MLFRSSIFKLFWFISILFFLLCFLISGGGTTNFIHTAFSAKPMLIGQAGFTCLFSGDGHLIADPLLVRTGTQEYLVIDTDDRFWNIR